MQCRYGNGFDLRFMSYVLRLMSNTITTWRGEFQIAEIGEKTYRQAIIELLNKGLIDSQICNNQL